MAMGFLPIRDMVPLPDVSEDFAAHALVGCLAVGEQARRRGDDRHAEAAQHLGQVGRFAYTRRPGLETRRRPAMLRSRLGPYLRFTTSFLPTSASSTR